MAVEYATFRERRFFANLDGVRAVAVLAVVAWHVAPSDLLRSLRGGRGVEWFFALSGFLITTLALREEETAGSVRIRAFFQRRAFRILPLYTLALLVVFVADVVVYRNPALTDGWKAYWPYYVTMTQDIPFKLGWANAPFAVAWSLGIEEKFYLVWPVLGFVVLRNRSRFQVTATIAIGIAFVELAWPGSVLGRLLGSYLPIIAGCLVALLAHQPHHFHRFRLLAQPVVLTTVIVLVAVRLPDEISAWRGYGPIYAALIAAAVAGLAMRPSVPVLSSPVMLWIGRRSYAIYLFHSEAIRIVTKATERLGFGGGEFGGLVIFAGALTVSLAVAEAVHRTVEKPLIRLGRTVSERRPQYAPTLT